MPEQPSPSDHVFHVGDAGQIVFLTGRDEGSGWAGFFPNTPAPTAFLRFLGKDWRTVAPVSGRPIAEEGTVGREAPFYDIVELYLADLEGITGRDLRALPLGQIEAAVNQPLNAARMSRYANKAEDRLGLTFDFGVEALGARTPKRRRPRMTIRVPEGNKKPDSFYEQVAYRYGWLQGEGLRAAQELAEANGVPVTTVHRWIKEARRRGLMAPGQRGTRKGRQQ